MEIQEILETDNGEIRKFVQEFWAELRQTNGDIRAGISTGITFAEFKCYQQLPLEIREKIDLIGKTPADFVRILRDFIIEFITDETSICRETFEYIGLPDLIGDYFFMKEVVEKSEFINEFTDDEAKLFIKQLSNAPVNSSFSSGYTFFYKLKDEEKELVLKPCSTPVRIEKRLRNSFVKHILECTDLVSTFDLDFLSLEELMDVLVKAHEIVEAEKQIVAIVKKRVNEAVANSVEIIE